MPRQPRAKLAGSRWVVIGDERLELDGEHFVRVDSGTGRVVASGPDGLRVLILGGVPGAAYEAPDWSSG